MTPNVGTADRLARFVAAALLFACSALAPLPLLVRVFACGVPGLYLLATAAFGGCLGYRLLGLSTCPAGRSS